jgi:DNA-directed RNA polymerase specialized sigma24 family protein
MVNDGSHIFDFKAIISPHLVPLLQYALMLTKNGLYATSLVREALTEASQSFNESLPERHWDMRVQGILTRRFLQGKQEHLSPIVQIHPELNNEVPARDNVLFPVVSDTEYNQLRPTAGPVSDESYFTAIASMPAVCRSAMILSYLEGFSVEVIAGLSGAQPKVIEPLVGRGRRFLDEQLFLHLVDDESAEASEKREAQST